MKIVNPKDLLGIKKIPYSCLPVPVIAEIAVAMFEGALKHGRHNYRKAEVIASIYFDAAKRHMDAFMEGEDIDPDSDIHHLSKAIASLIVLRDGIMNGMCIDDRPPKSMNGKWMEDLNKKVEDLLERYPDPKDPFLENESDSK